MIIFCKTPLAIHSDIELYCFVGFYTSRYSPNVDVVIELLRIFYILS